jgi:3-hydroxypropanoate dehydrogenase
MNAPVTAIIAYDTQFQEHLPRLFPHNQAARSWFDGDAKKAGRETAAFRNGTLQGAYFILAARAIGLDCGPMSGFDNAQVDAEFFPDGRFRSNFLCNLGVGDPAKVFARSPRFEFDEVCQVL